MPIRDGAMPMSDCRECKSSHDETLKVKTDGCESSRACGCDHHANPMVKSLADLMEQAGIWVTLLVFGQIVVAFLLAERIQTCLPLPWQGGVCALVAVYMVLDAIAYFLLRGRLISRWLVPALSLAGAALLPGVAVWFV